MIMQVKTDNKGTLNLRADASSSSKILAQIPYGSVLEAEKVNENWSKVSYNNKNGYVMNKFLQTPSASASTFDKDKLQAIYDHLKTTLSLIENLLK